MIVQCVLPSLRGSLARCGLRAPARGMAVKVNAEPVYELRTYTVYPEKMKEYLSLTAQEFHLRTAHSKLLGFWTAEVGGLNQVVHIWEYDSLSHRAGVRASLAGDSEWLGRYVGRVIGMWQQQDNCAMTLLPGVTVTTPEGKGVYELQTLNFQGAGWSSALAEYVKACGGVGVEGSSVVGVWRSVVGPRDMATILWRHSGPDSCVALKEALGDLPEDSALASHVTSGHSKLLLPHVVSPLQ